ncbi:MAG: hypothetical protein KKG47_11595 [Proteobacteria bacterium]|nr:hypothetical protein [Pseudomonadota bacterium]MBU1739455.1 hypothetical protein [Pseudomonadota bacterium]
MSKPVILLVLIFSLPIRVDAVAGDDAGVGRKEAWLQSYEPNRIGWTFDDNDVGYMDFTVSLQYPFLSLESAKAAKEGAAGGRTLSELSTRYLRSIPYFAFTGRFGQYIGTRESSPVIGKRFNPKLFLRFFTRDPEKSFIDLGYGHESNGQRTNSFAAYQDLRSDFIRDGEDPEFANDYISRGWDYWEVVIFRNFGGIEKNEGADSTGDDGGSGEGFSSLLSLKYFLEKGALQGEAEEYNSWENDSNGRPRKEVDGITVKMMYKTKEYPIEFEKLTLSLFGGFSIVYTTGYKSAFSNNTVRLESLIKIGSFPLMVWWSDGYNSDLVDYYRRVRSGGFGLDLTTF